MLDCPAYSPDLSPIEHVWDVLVEAVHRRHPLPTNNDQLRIALQEERESIPHVTSDNLAMYLQRRYAALRQSNGGHTGYWLCDLDVATSIAL